MQDRSIHRYLPALKDALAELKADAEIAALHAETVRLHRAKRDALMAQPAYRDMYDALAKAPTLPPEEEALLRELGIPA
jgi:hypothetical protein